MACKAILNEFCDRIGVEVGGTSEDLKFSVAQTSTPILSQNSFKIS